MQVITPTANWYGLFLAVCTICWMSWVPVGTRYRDVGSGFLLGSTFLFRQLSGVLLAMGALVFLLLERPRSEERGGRELARAVIVVVGMGLGAYLAHATDALGWTLFGIWPFPVLVLAWRQTAARNKELAATASGLLLGAAIAAMPLVIYHAVHGSVGAWLSDTVGAATSLPRLAFMKLPGYALMMILAGRGLVFGGLAERLNGLLWLTLLVLAAALGVTFLRVVLRRSADTVMHPLPVIALFYSIVSVHYQITLYLFYAAGLSLSALLWQFTGRGKALRATALLCASVVAAIAVYYQAGMPLSRGLKGTVAGERLPVGTRLELDRAGIYVEREDAVRFKRVVDFIQSETGPSDTIFALPGESELYFLANRTNPFKFFNTALGIRSSAGLDSTIWVLKCRPPKLIFYNPEDKYNTAASARIAAFVRATYDSLTPLPPFQVFRRRNTVVGDVGTQAACHVPGSV